MSSHLSRYFEKKKIYSTKPQSNRCEIALSDLERFIPGQPPGYVQARASESRIAALEHRVQVLEQQVQRLLSRPQIPKTSRSSRRAERTTGPLPEQLIPLPVFANHHNVAEATVRMHMEMGVLPVKCGEWTDVEGAVVLLAFDAQGQKAFYQLYRGLLHFTRCSQCPHGYLDTV